MTGIKLDTPGFSGHETFPFRYGWIKKGVDAVSESPDVFNQDSSLVRLGVGRNMVRSIRHWCLTAGLLQEHRSGNQHLLSVSPLGEYLFGEWGKDPFLEDSGTLWLLHWRIATNTRRATTWFWAFSHWHQPDVRKEWLVQRLLEMASYHGWERIASSSVSRDVDCFIRTYVPARASKVLLLEDTLDCPLVELGLIKELPDHKTYRFVRGRKPTLPDAVFTYAVVDYWNRVSPMASSLSLEGIAHGSGSPGRAFQLDENSLVERLERLEDLSGGAYLYRESAGIKQVLRTGGHLDPNGLLNLYYDREGV